MITCVRTALAVVWLTLTLACSVAVHAAPVFPVKYSSDQRYLVDQNNQAFPIMGRTAWFVLSLPTTDYRAFIDDTAARGYNTIELHVLNHDPRGNHPPLNGNGDAPFIKRLDGGDWNGSLSYGNINSDSPNFATLNPAYWSFVDDFLAYCESKGILVLLFPAYVGFDGGNQGWMKEMVANNVANMQSYGVQIATRYKNQKNLVWMMGGDMGTAPYTFNTAQAAVEAALLAGLKSVAGQQSTLFSAEWASGSISAGFPSGSIGTDQSVFGSAMTLNSVYAGGGDVSFHGRRAYAGSPAMPAFLLEEPFDEEGPDGTNVNPNATQPVRRYQWWGWLSTIGGYVSGNGYVWPFNSDWSAHLDTQGTRDMARMNGFIQSIAWYKLIPSGLNGMRTLISGSGSSLNPFDYVTAAATADGTLLVAYLPPDHNAGPVTVDMTAMAGPSMARWFDPTDGTYVSIGTDLANSGTQTFVPPGNNAAHDQDWVLVLTYAPLQPPTNLRILTGSRSAPPDQRAHEG